MIYDLIRDFSSVVSALPEKHPQRRLLSLVEEALRRDAQFLDRHPTTLFQCLWNSCWWHDCPGVEDHYVPRLKLVSSGDTLSSLMERWREYKEKNTPSLVWCRSLMPPRIRLGTGQQAILRGHLDEVQSLAFSSDGTWLLSGSKDGQIRVWDTGTGAETLSMSTREGPVTCLAYFPDQTIAARGTAQGTIHVFESLGGTELRSYAPYANPASKAKVFRSDISALVISADGSQIACGASGGAVCVLRGQNDPRKQSLSDHPITGLAFSRDGKTLVAGDRTGQVWRLIVRSDGLDVVEKVGSTKGAVMRLAFSSDESRLVAVASDTSLYWFDLSRTGTEDVAGGGRQSVACADLTPTTDRLSAATSDGTIHVWDANDLVELARFMGHEGTVNIIRFSPSGKLLASAGSDRTIRLWDASAIRQASRMRGHEYAIARVQFVEYGDSIQTTDSTGVIFNWDTWTGQCTQSQEVLSSVLSRSGWCEIWGEFPDYVLRVPGSDTACGWLPGIASEFIERSDGWIVHPTGRVFAAGFGSYLGTFALECSVATAPSQEQRADVVAQPTVSKTRPNPSLPRRVTDGARPEADGLGRHVFWWSGKQGQSWRHWFRVTILPCLSDSRNGPFRSVPISLMEFNESRFPLTNWLMRWLGRRKYGVYSIPSGRAALKLAKARKDVLLVWTSDDAAARGSPDDIPNLLRQNSEQPLEKSLTRAWPAQERLEPLDSGVWLVFGVSTEASKANSARQSRPTNTS